MNAVFTTISRSPALFALDGRAVGARSAITECVTPQSYDATLSDRFAATSPIKDEDLTPQ